MTEVEFSRLLSELSDTAKKLNKESDSLNEVISQSEEMLRRMNVGLEVWVDSDPLSSWPWTEEGRDGEPWERGTEDLQLGFAEVEGAWHLALRRARYETVDPQTNFIVNRLHEIDGEAPLARASRSDRIAGIKRLPDLVKHMQAEAEAALKAIEAAKKLVK